MRLNTAIYLAGLFVAPKVSNGFQVTGRSAATRASTSLEARRSLFPVLRRSDLLFPDMDAMFEEMDEMMESHLATRRPRPSLSLLGRGIPKDLASRRPLGFEVTQDEKECKIAIHVPGVDAKDVDLHLDGDGRVLRLKGNTIHEDGGMKVQTRFEKAILLGPDVDTEKLAASMSGNTLTVSAPKVEAETVDNAKVEKIEIEVGEPEATMQDEMEPAEDVAGQVPTQLAVEKLTDEGVEPKKDLDGEKRWPAKDFPY